MVVREADSKLHKHLSNKFPKLLKYTDRIATYILRTISKGPFAIILTLLFTAFGVAGLMDMISTVLLICAALITLLWIAKSKALGKLTIPSRCVAVIAIGSCLIMGSTYASSGISKLVLSHYKPDLSISLNNQDHFEFHLVDHKLKRYLLLIDNRNKNSVSITDLRINFYFKNMVAKTTINPVLLTGAYTVGPGYAYLPQKDGSVKEIETAPTDSVLAKEFSFTIPQIISDKENQNQNRALLACERWPDNTVLFGTILVDLSKWPGPIVDAPSKIGTYEGEYHYAILNKKHVEQIKGVIPSSEMDNRLEKLFGMNPCQGQIDLTFDPGATKRILSEPGKLDLLPHIKAEVFEICIEREDNMTLRVLLSNAFSKEIMLKSRPVGEMFIANGSHKITVVWGSGVNKLFIDNVLEDESPKKRR